MVKRPPSPYYPHTNPPPNPSRTTPQPKPSSSPPSPPAAASPVSFAHAPSPQSQPVSQLALWYNPPPNTTNKKSHKFLPLLTSSPPSLKPQYGLGGLRIRNRQAYGLEFALAASVLLAGSSFPRAVKTMKPLPIGLSVVAAFGLYRFGMLWRAQV